MANLKILQFPQKIINKAMNIRSRQLDQKRSLKTNSTADKIQDECFKAINSLVDAAIEKYDNPRVLISYLLEIKDALKVYAGAEIKDDLSRLNIIDDNKAIGEEAKDAAGLAEQEIHGAINA